MKNYYQFQIGLLSYKGIKASKNGLYIFQLYQFKIFQGEVLDDDFFNKPYNNAL